MGMNEQLDRSKTDDWEGYAMDACNHLKETDKKQFPESMTEPL
jgi:hypothetical protein